jgi:multidrug resistance efflux pump
MPSQVLDYLIAKSERDLDLAMANLRAAVETSVKDFHAQVRRISDLEAQIALLEAEIRRLSALVPVESP